MTIVLYHGVAPVRALGIYNYRGKCIDPDLFEKQVRYFKKHYTILSLDGAVEKMRKKELPRNALAISFDDGYRNVYEYAFPILKKYATPATVYLVSDFVLRGIPLWVDRLEYAIGALPLPLSERIARDAKIRQSLKRLLAPKREERLSAIERESGADFTDFEGERSVYAPLSLSDMREMRRGNIAFGAHTKTHPILSMLSETDSHDEIRSSVRALEDKLGPLSRSFAYPNGNPGDWNESAERFLKAEGFTCALTTIEGFNSADTNPYRLRRFSMDATDEKTFAVVASGVRLFLKRLSGYAR